MRMGFHWLMEKYQEATTMVTELLLPPTPPLHSAPPPLPQVSVNVVDDSDGQWEVVPAPKPLDQIKKPEEGAKITAAAPSDAASRFGFSRPAQVG